MHAVKAATLTAFYLFDVAEQIDLPRVRGTVGDAATPARLAGGRGSPSYLQYTRPPVVVESEALGFGEFDGFRARAKFFDYGVLSLGLSRPFTGNWSDLVRVTQRYIENDALEEKAEACCRSLVARFDTAMRGVRARFLTEDYLVVAVTSLETCATAEELIATHGREIAQILRGEVQPLSTQEQEEILRNRLSYFPDDLVIPTWNAAFIHDSEAGAHAALEIVEFANSQLLEFRYYDELLDVELGRIYGQLQRPHWWDSLSGRGSLRAAHQLKALFIDVNEITDQTQNALKMVGDIYAARLFHLTASRLGLEPWKASVEEKLTTLNDIYRFAVEQVGMSRGHLLELTIIAILVLELVLFFMGIMR
ncbi:MAG: hypothetical protein WBC51_17730 [Vicinamibacterales bacterium]